MLDNADLLSADLWDVAEKKYDLPWSYELELKGNAAGLLFIAA